MSRMPHFRNERTAGLIDQITRYNDLLTQFKAQAATISQMAAEYNAKVKHYGK